MCHLGQAARLDLATGSDRMLCPWEEWYPSRGVAASLPISWLAAQADGSWWGQELPEHWPGALHHAGSLLIAQRAPDSEALLFKLERALVCQLLTDSQGYLPSAGSQLGKIIFHAFYFIRQNLLSFGPRNIPWRKGRGLNRERSHECLGDWIQVRPVFSTPSSVLSQLALPTRQSWADTGGCTWSWKQMGVRAAHIPGRQMLEHRQSAGLNLLRPTISRREDLRADLKSHMWGRVQAFPPCSALQVYGWAQAGWCPMSWV